MPSALFSIPCLGRKLRPCGSGANRAISIISSMMGLCSNINWVRIFQCRNNNAGLIHVKLHYYRVGWVEPCHQLGWSSQALVLCTRALPSALPRQQQTVKHQIDNLNFWNWTVAWFNHAVTTQSEMFIQPRRRNASKPAHRPVQVDNNRACGFNATP